MSGSPSSYRDRIYIVKDVILKLVEYGELNQTALVSFCGLNLKKHKSILEDIEDNDLIEKREVTLGKRTVTMYRPTQKGMAFCRDILEPYETMFPRRKEEQEEGEEEKKKEESSTEGSNEKKNLNKGSLMLVLI
ncbi:MAG TPA: winged helix-turn-helix domain-containing protein [Nitrososphaeraceae archaeon]|nr:winged helix-turn-helix domain-containing protein [Nitrososphaeraceae archaeon]